MTYLTYKDAGVDIKKADLVLNRIKPKIHSTYNPFVLNSIGGFASLTEIPPGYKNPVMVSSTDGVGTKLKIAFQSGKHDTVGIDLVGMSVNDILTMGAKPYFFLDYFAAGRINEKIYQDVIDGICQGCLMADCALIGGETAEMPSFYKDNEYDLAGFAIGFLDRDKIVNGSAVRDGDTIIALASNGLHSNGFSLVRKTFFEIHNVDVNEHVDELGMRLFEELLKPTRIYVKPVLKVLENVPVHGMVHITGGGLPGNIERVLPEGLSAHLEVQGDRVPPIFKVIQNMGNVQVEEMCATFNMGLGFVIIADSGHEKAIIETLENEGEKAFVVGSVRREQGDKRVTVEFSGL